MHGTFKILPHTGDTLNRGVAGHATSARFLHNLPFSAVLTTSDGCKLNYIYPRLCACKTRSKTVAELYLINNILTASTALMQLQEDQFFRISSQQTPFHRLFPAQLGKTESALKKKWRGRWERWKRKRGKATSKEGNVKEWLEKDKANEGQYGITTVGGREYKVLNCVVILFCAALGP